MNAVNLRRQTSIVLVALMGSWIFLAWLDAEPTHVFAAQEKKDKSEGKKGRTIGVLTAKSEKFIEVKADGEVKGRKYVPRWIGGLPADGGGPEKTMLKTFRTLKLGSRIQVEWIFEERLRAVKIKVLQEPEKE